MGKTLKRKILETFLIGLMLTACGGIVLADPLARAQTASEYSQNNQQAEQQSQERRRQENLEVERRVEQIRKTQLKYERLHELQRQRRQTEERKGAWLSTADLQEECDLTLEIKKGAQPSEFEACKLLVERREFEHQRQERLEKYRIRLDKLAKERKNSQATNTALAEECDLETTITNERAPGPHSNEACTELYIRTLELRERRRMEQMDLDPT
jgi:TolA-binding protein